MQQSASLTTSRTTCCKTNAQLIEVTESDTQRVKVKVSRSISEGSGVNVDLVDEAEGEVCKVRVRGVLPVQDLDKDAPHLRP